MRDIESAPKDGTPIQAKIPGHGSDNIIAWFGGLVDEDDGECGGWHYMEGEPPACWTDGVCWDVNEDGEESARPTHWRPSPPQTESNTENSNG